MEVTVLVDNIPHPSKKLIAEHGLSLYFEADGYKWLFDTGESAIFAENAQKLGINLAAVDYIILSHGHHDHTGGLATFANINTKAKIFLSAEMHNSLFFSLRQKRRKNISPDHNLLETLSERLVWVHHNTAITDKVSIVNQIPVIFPAPKANNKLVRFVDGNERPDEFTHEIALIVKQPKGLVVFSGCSHKGLLNILHACTQPFDNIPVLACIGGTHLLDSDAEEPYETAFEIAHIGKSIQQNYPQMQLITGHCTGTLAKKVLADTLGENFQAFYTGYSVKI